MTHNNLDEAYRPTSDRHSPGRNHSWSSSPLAAQVYVLHSHHRSLHRSHLHNHRNRHHTRVHRNDTCIHLDIKRKTKKVTMIVASTATATMTTTAMMEANSNRLDCRVTHLQCRRTKSSEREHEEERMLRGRAYSILFSSSHLTDRVFSFHFLLRDVCYGTLCASKERE